MSYVCPECFDEIVLKRRVKELRAASKTTSKCRFHQSRKGIPVEQVAELFDPVIRATHSVGDYDWNGEPEGDDLAQVVLELGEMDDYDAAKLVARALIEADPYLPQDGEEPFFSDEYGYVTSPGTYGAHYSVLWDRFRKSILHSARFFNEGASTALQEIFEDVHRQHSVEGPVVYTIGPHTSAKAVYRARLADDQNLRKILENPWIELSVPPEGMRKPGRMNASGIGVFYGAFDRETCVAELRPPVGETVAVGQFSLLRELCVLDLTRFAAPQKHKSNFAKYQIKRNEQWSFLQRFRRAISLAVLDSKSYLDYVPTQVVAEYIGSQLRVKVDGTTRRIDGIIYESAQHRAGKNIALFGAASSVKVPAMGRGKTPPELDWIDEMFAFDDKGSSQEPALSISADDVTELRVTGAHYDTIPLQATSTMDL